VGMRVGRLWSTASCQQQRRDACDASRVDNNDEMLVMQKTELLCGMAFPLFYRRST
jgi:hypothetical protein